MKGAWNGTLYELLGNTLTNGWLSCRVEMKKIEPLLSLEKRHCCGIKNLDILKKKAIHDKDIVEGISYYTLDFVLCKHCIYDKEK
jgi:hypothetical protein